MGLGVLLLLTIAIISWLFLRLERVRAFVHLCAWSRSVEYDGEWITFEDYLQRRFNVHVRLGISPVEAAKFIDEHRDPRR